MPRTARRSLLIAPPLLALVSGCASPVGDGRVSDSSSNRTTPRATPVRDSAPRAPLTTVERSSLRERALGVLEEAVFDEWAAVRANAMEGLAQAPSRSGNVVRAGLADENEGVRAIAAALAGRLSLTGTAPSLRALLDDPSPYVRVGAITGLALLGEDVDQSPLAKLLEHRDWDVRRQAAYALGEIGNPSAIPLLRAALRGPGMSVPSVNSLVFRIQVSEAQAKLGEYDELSVIRAALYPQAVEEIEGAILAAQILGELRDQESASQLVEIVEYVRGEAPSGRQRVDWLYPPELRLAAATALVKMGYTPEGYIGTAFHQSPNPAIRAQVAFLYGEIGSPEMLDRLGVLMDDENTIVRVSAASAVVKATSGR